MAKSINTTYPTLTLLLGALIFTLSSIPGVNSEVEIGTISMSSTSDCQTLGTTLHGNENAECNVEATNTTGGQTFQGRVRAKKVVTGPTQELGQAAPTPGKTVVELETEAQAPCITCTTGVRTGRKVKVTVEVSEVPNLKAIAERIVQESARTLAADIKADADRLARVEKCEEDEQGQKIEGLNQIMECRVNKLKGMDQRKAEAYFDKHIRKQLQDMISGTEGQDAAIRAGNRASASELVATLKENMGNSVYLRASIAEIQRFGQAHQNADIIIAKQALLATLPAGSRERLTLQNEITTLARQFNGDRAYFASRGVTISSQLTGQIEADQISTLTADLDAYQKSLDAVANQHRQLLNGTNRITPGPVQPGVLSYGTDPRSRLGAPATSYTQMPGAPTAPGARPPLQAQQPLRPGAPAQGRFPVGGQRVLQ